MGSMKSEEASYVELNVVKSPCHPDTGFAATMPVQDKSSSLNVAIKNDPSLSIYVLFSISQRRP